MSEFRAFKTSSNPDVEEIALVVPVSSDYELDTITTARSNESHLFDPETGAVLFSPYQENGELFRVVVRLKKRK